MLPGHLAADVLPHTLDRIEFWAASGQEEQSDVLWHPKRFDMAPWWWRLPLHAVSLTLMAPIWLPLRGSFSQR